MGRMLLPTGVDDVFERFHPSCCDTEICVMNRIYLYNKRVNKFSRQFIFTEDTRFTNYVTMKKVLLCIGVTAAKPRFLKWMLGEKNEDAPYILGMATHVAHINIVVD